MTGLPLPEPGQAQTITMTDPDGTRHTFTKDLSEPLAYKPPPGVHLRLRVASNAVEGERVYAITRPDGTTFDFDRWGFARSVEDHDGNMITFEYTYVALATGAHCTTVVPFVCAPRLVRIVDPAGRRAGGITSARGADHDDRLLPALAAAAAAGERRQDQVDHRPDRPPDRLRLRRAGLPDERDRGGRDGRGADNQLPVLPGRAPVPGLALPALASPTPAERTPTSSTTPIPASASSSMAARSRRSPTARLRLASTGSRTLTTRSTSPMSRTAATSTGPTRSTSATG